MEHPLISVIVPVYKAEAYLQRCVDSIRHQTYPNLEILLVDDGSPDGSGALCDAFAAADSRIRVFHKENGGQSSARNLGLDEMRGEYVAFVDSDDWIEANMYEGLYSLAVAQEAQIVCCGMVRDFPNGRSEHFNPFVTAESGISVFSRRDALRENLRNCAITYSPCDKLYHKSIFANLRMTVGKIYEDMEIIPKCIEHAQTVVYDPTPYYHYIMTETSTIRGEFQPRRFAEVDVAWEKAEDYKIRYPELYHEALARYLGVCLHVVHLSCGVASCKELRKDLIRRLRKSYPKEAVCRLSRKEKIKFRCLRFSSFLYECMMRLYDWRKKG